MNSETISVPRELLERIAQPANSSDSRYDRLMAIHDLRALLAKPAKPPKSECPHCLGDSMFGCTECEPDYQGQHQGEPIRLTAVAELADDGDGGLEPSWILEGGTAELFAGMTLLVADNAPDLCHEDGSAEVYTRPAEQPEPISSTSDKYRAELYDEVWQKARDMGFGNVTDALIKLEKQLQGNKSR